MSGRLFDAPVDPDTLTERQRAALEIVRANGPMNSFEFGIAMGYRPGDRRMYGSRMLRTLESKGLVRFKRRVGWALVGEDARTASGLPGLGAADPSSPTSGQTGEIPF